MRMGKIVCTIGPACDSLEMLKTLMQNGMDVARLNFSHGTPEQHLEILNNIKEARKQVGKNVGIMADFQGPRFVADGLKRTPTGRTKSTSTKARISS